MLLTLTTIRIRLMLVALGSNSRIILDTLLAEAILTTQLAIISLATLLGEVEASLRVIMVKMAGNHERST